MSIEGPVFDQIGSEFRADLHRVFKAVLQGLKEDGCQEYYYFTDADDVDPFYEDNVDLTGAFMKFDDEPWKLEGFSDAVIGKEAVADIINKFVIPESKLATIDYDNACEVAFMVNYKKLERARVRGVGTQLALAKRSHLRYDLGMRTMIATVEPSNIKSIRILKKIGLELASEKTIESKPGFLRDCYIGNI